MVCKSKTKSHRRQFTFICGWNPIVGTYVAEVSGTRMPHGLLHLMILAARLGKFEAGTRRDYVLDDEVLRKTEETAVCEYEFDSKSRKKFACYPVFGPFRGNL